MSDCTGRDVADPRSAVRLDVETLRLFEAKGRPAGHEGGAGRNPNAVKVRRVMQVMQDFAHLKPGLRVLDLACGEGVYAIEAALRGAVVLAIDARTERMEEGARAARRLGLANLRFEQEDVRRVTLTTHGSFEVILFLGMLYHLDVPDVFNVIENLHAMCRRLLVIDTHVALTAERIVQHGQRRYEGRDYGEHGADDPASLRRGRLLASIDNSNSFWLTKPSLVALLRHSGFSSVFECLAPPEPGKPSDRITLVALKGDGIRLASYPWINETSDEDVENHLGVRHEAARPVGRAGKAFRGAMNRVLRPFGWSIDRT